MSLGAYYADEQEGEEQEDIEEEIVLISEEDLLKELDKQEPALQVRATLACFDVCCKWK